MPLSVKQGDLFTCGLSAIGHGVNTAGIMGAGIALQFRHLFPEMHDYYQARCQTDELKVGGVLAWFDDASDQVIYNLATQPYPGKCATVDNIRNAVASMLEMAAGVWDTPTVGLPCVGAGLGGLRWSDVLVILKEVCDASPVEVVVYQREKVASSLASHLL